MKVFYNKDEREYTFRFTRDEFIILQVLVSVGYCLYDCLEDDCLEDFDLIPFRDFRDDILDVDIEL